MKKVMFVCHGNICRSPMAEFIFKDIVKKNNRENEYLVNSSATSLEEIGNDMYYLAKEELKKHDIEFTTREARRITQSDFDSYDLIIVMDDSNLENLNRIINITNQNKVYKLKNFLNSNDDIYDPWYSRNFSLCFKEINSCCSELFTKLESKQ